MPDGLRKSQKNDVALAWFKNNNEIIHFDPTSGLLLENEDSNKPIFNNISVRVSPDTAVRWQDSNGRTMSA